MAKAPKAGGGSARNTSARRGRQAVSAAESHPAPLPAAPPQSEANPESQAAARGESRMARDGEVLSSAAEEALAPMLAPPTAIPQPAPTKRKAKPAPRTPKPSAPKPRATANSRAARQVVIVVHGMGEQRPMDTISAFAATAWRDAPELMRAHDRPPEAAAQTPAREIMWNRPDPRLGSLELRKITTRASRPSTAFPGGVHTDFVELYWADLTEGATMRGVLAWFKMLLWRSPARAPTHVLGHYYLLWIVLLAALGVLSVGLLHYLGLIVLPNPWANIIAWVSRIILGAGGILLVLGRYAENVLVSRIGRVARYTQARPENIEARAATRERGLRLLRTLHADPSVARIIVVGHSLGSILAYDLLTYYWAELDAPRSLDPVSDAPHDKEKFAAYLELEAAKAQLEGLAADAPDAARAAALAQWRRAQARFRRALAHGVETVGADGRAQQSGRWLISDFFTLGSPLAHAEFLLAADRDNLLQRQQERELPTNPPVSEPLDQDDARMAHRLGLSDRAMSYWSDRRKGPRGWRLHHATPFAAVRWTNLHDRPKGLFLFGDFVSGPVGRKADRGGKRKDNHQMSLFGPGVRDLWLKDKTALAAAEAARAETRRRLKMPPLSGARTGRGAVFTHTRYWHHNAPQARLTLFRQALDLLDEDGEA